MSLLIVCSLFLAPQLQQPGDPAATLGTVRLLDVTGDGLLDELRLGSDGSVSVAVNVGTKTFMPVQQSLPNVIVTDVLVSDLDGDTLPDLYLVSPTSNVALLGDGSGYFHDATSRLGLADVGLGESAERIDVDADGLMDMLLHNAKGDVLFWAIAPGHFERDQASPNGTDPTGTVVTGTGGGVTPNDGGTTTGTPPSGPAGVQPVDAAPPGGSSVITVGPGAGGMTLGGRPGIDGPVPPPTIPPVLEAILDDKYVNDNMNEVDSADIIDGSLTGADVSTSGGDVTFPGAVLTAEQGVFGTGAVATGTNSTVSGGLSNTASGYWSTVGGGLVNAASYRYSTVGGGRNNAASEIAATVGGGQFNSASGYWSTVSGGLSNTASGRYATVGGGDTNTASGYYATVGGGRDNTASEDDATVGGGEDNAASGRHATVGGGDTNTASGYYATVGGGEDNAASGRHATVGGGRYNEASGYYSTVAGGGGMGILSAYPNVANGYWSAVSGGLDNAASGVASTVGGGLGNTASGFNSATVGGGFRNEASASFATVSGGQENVASGNFSTVPGGRDNTADGSYSFASGRRAKANHTGAFVWGDSFNGDKASSAADEFNVYASGGTRIFSNTAATLGAALLPNATAWSVLSDRASKENIQPVDTRAVLEAVAAMPITTWNYKANDDAVRHMGPMAQDFHAAFGLGQSHTMIETIDPDGVALAAIQGLNKRMDETVADKDAEIAELKARLQTVEALLAELMAR